jgi:hypothetical protein
MGMAQQQGCGAETVIDIFVAIDVPFPGPEAAFDGDWEGAGYVTVVATSAGRENLFEPWEKRCRFGVSSDISLSD